MCAWNAGAYWVSAAAGGAGACAASRREVRLAAGMRAGPSSPESGSDCGPEASLEGYGEGVRLRLDSRVRPAAAVRSS